MVADRIPSLQAMTMGGHLDHVPGTQPDCPDCAEDAYEPGWYRALRDERVLHRSHDVVLIPEAVVEANDAPPAEVTPEALDDSLIAVPELANLKAVYGQANEDPVE